MYEMYLNSPTKRWQLKRSNFRKQHFAMKREDVIKSNFRKVNDSNIILEKKWTKSNIVNKMHLKWSCFFIVFFFGNTKSNSVLEFLFWLEFNCSTRDLITTKSQRQNMRPVSRLMLWCLQSPQRVLFYVRTNTSSK